MDEAGPEHDERELTELADELLLQATEIRRQWTQLAGALGMEDPSGTLDAAIEGSRSWDAGDDSARLVALDMLLSGRSREEIADHLRRTFDDLDVDAVVESVFADYGE